MIHTTGLKEIISETPSFPEEIPPRFRYLDNAHQKLGLLYFFSVRKDALVADIASRARALEVRKVKVTAVSLQSIANIFRFPVYIHPLFALSALGFW